MDKRYRITLDTDKQDILDTHIVICQGDKGFVFDIELVGIDMTNATARLIIHKPDNNVIESALTESNGRYTYTFLGNEVSTVGTVVADVKIIESTTKRVSTTRFKFYVEIDTISGAVIESQSYSTSLENAINQAKRYAVGGVEDGDATDNAKYYKEQAEYAASQASAATGMLDENGKILSSLIPTGIDAETLDGKHAGDFLPKTNIANNLTTTEEGFALDARQGKILNDRLKQFTLPANGSITLKPKYEDSYAYLITSNGWLGELNYLKLLITGFVSFKYTYPVELATIGNGAITYSFTEDGKLVINSSSSAEGGISVLCLYNNIVEVS